jgi:HNH endonuclease
MEQTGFWIFVSNPKRYPIDAHMREYLPKNQGVSSWTVERNADFKRGDLGLVRVGVDARNKATLKRDGASKRLGAGIYAVCKVLGEPSYTLERADDARWTPPKDMPSIPIRYLWWTTTEPLLITEISQEYKGFNKHILDGLQRKTFPIPEDDFWTIVDRLPNTVRQAIDGATDNTMLDPEDANTDPFDPENVSDARNRVLRTIRERRGQKQFRDDLLNIYGRRCAITGCSIVDVLEAAHVTPYLGAATNHVTNGLLLRADLHTLLDCGLLSIDPSTRSVLLAPAIRESADYKHLHGLRLREPVPSSDAPSMKALKNALLMHTHLSETRSPTRQPISVSI